MPKKQTRKAVVDGSVYTYRCGEKLTLVKRPDRFVVRALPDELNAKKRWDAEKMSSASSLVSCDLGVLEELMEEARNLAPTHHAYEQAPTGEEFLITDRIMVEFEHRLSHEEVGDFAGKYALEIVERYSETEYMFRLTTATGINPVKLVVLLTEEDERVAIAEHDLNMRMTMAVDLPSDPAYARQWHLHTRFQHSEYDPRSSVRCEGAWQLLDGFGDSDVVVGVTDDGCRLSHPDFDSDGKFNRWGYFEGINLLVRGDAGALESRMYQLGANHGTACAGVIGAESDGTRTVGAAPGCRLLPIKWESSGPFLLISDSKLRKALEYMADRVDIISNSWGSTPTTNMSLFVVNRIRELARSGGRRGKGILFLWAAGNDNCPISHVASVKVPFTTGWRFSNGARSWIGVETTRVFQNNRVGIPGVLHVAALASSARRSHYSNYGTGIELCAPTSNSHEYRRMTVSGLGVTTTTGNSGEVRNDFGGTSSATPLVAGVAALVISANPLLTAVELASILRRTCSKDIDATGYPRTPAATYDRNTSWDVSPVEPFDHGEFQDIGHPDGSWSPWFGHGRVDAVNAVREALRLAELNTTRVRIERIADLAIPDRNPAGVSSRIHIGDSGRIQSLAIQVDIKHTYIGDLEVTLVGPDGRRVDLHRRAGHRTVNLIRGYDENSTPALATFIGTEINGTWALEVVDQAAIDTGTLDRWSVEAEVLTGAGLIVQSTPGRIIPDNVAHGIEDRVTVSESLEIKRLSVELDISHSWISDLRIVLQGPDGQEAVLHEFEGGSSDDIKRVFDSEHDASLESFVGSDSAGEWQLAVSDHADRDVGKLNRWSLSIE